MTEIFSWNVLEINVEKADLRIVMTRSIRPDKFQNPYTEMMAKNFMTRDQYFPTRYMP